MPQQVRGVVVDPAAPGKLSIKPVELRDPDRDEVAVRVTAISLNRGETRRAVQQAEPGWRPGWDFAGVAETAAADGSGPKPGTRVVGILPSGAWAERVNCRTHAVAALPDAVDVAEAATLPVAGLTALHALRQGGLLLGRKVLVDGASGGVGHLACQLAVAAGAQVWGHVRREEYRAAVAEWCGERVVLGRELVVAKPHGPFWLILDSLGGSALGAALGMLQPGGTCVTFGVSEAAHVTRPGACCRDGRNRRGGALRIGDDRAGSEDYVDLPMSDTKWRSRPISPLGLGQTVSSKISGE
jgi:NADPH:quinone reductase